MIVTCPVCRRSLALADRNGRHVASEAHYPHPDASGTMICSSPTRADRGTLRGGADGEPRSPDSAPLRILGAFAGKLVPN